MARAGARPDRGLARTQSLGSDTPLGEVAGVASWIRPMPPSTGKRAFLKRGAGISRYEQGGMAEARQQYITKHNVSPVAEPSPTDAPSTGMRTPRSALNNAPPPTPEEELAEFEALEATVRRQSEGMLLAAGVDPEPVSLYTGPPVEIFAPPMPPPPRALPISSDEPVDEWIDGYDDDETKAEEAPLGDAVPAAPQTQLHESSEIPHEEPADALSPVQQALEMEGAAIATPAPSSFEQESEGDAAPSWSLLARRHDALQPGEDDALGAPHASRAGSTAGANEWAASREGNAKSAASSGYGGGSSTGGEHESSELWSAYSIFHSTGGVGTSVRADSDASSEDGRDASAAQGHTDVGGDDGSDSGGSHQKPTSSAHCGGAGGASDASGEDPEFLERYGEYAEGLTLGSTFTFRGGGSGSFATFDGSGGYGEPAGASTQPIQRDQPPPKSALVSAVFNQQRAQQVAAQRTAPSASRGQSRSGGYGGRGGKGDASSKGRGSRGASSEEASTEAAAMQAREEENRKLRRRVAQLSEQLEMSERGRAESEAAYQALSASAGGDASSPMLTAADRESLLAEVSKFEEHKASETRRLQRERRVLERQAKALLKVPDRKEREEVDNLKAELDKAKKEFAVREARFKVNVERLRKQLVTVEEQRDGLRQEVERLERARAEGISRSQSAVDRIAAAVAGAAGLPANTKAAALAATRGGGSTEPSKAMDAAHAAAEAAAAAVMAATSSAGVACAASEAAAEAAAQAAAAAVMEATGVQPNVNAVNQGAGSSRGSRSGRLQPKGIAFDSGADASSAARRAERVAAKDWSFADDDAPPHSGATVAQGSGSISGGSEDSASWMAPQPRLEAKDEALELMEAEAQVAVEAREYHEQTNKQQMTPSQTPKSQQTRRQPPPRHKQVAHEPANSAADAATAGSGSLAQRLTPAEVLLTNGFFLRVALNADEGPPLHEDVHPDGKVERSFRSGRCQVLYPTGTRKEVLPNGVQTVIFGNGDVKQTGLDRRVVYYYAEAATTHVSEPDGTQLYHFPNGQVERHFTDGLKEIRFTDGTLKVITPDGQVESVTDNDAAFARLAEGGGLPML